MEVSTVPNSHVLIPLSLWVPWVKVMTTLLCNSRSHVSTRVSVDPDTSSLFVLEADGDQTKGQLEKISQELLRCANSTAYTHKHVYNPQVHLNFHVCFLFMCVMPHTYSRTINLLCLTCWWSDTFRLDEEMHVKLCLSTGLCKRASAQLLLS